VTRLVETTPTATGCFLVSSTYHVDGNTLHDCGRVCYGPVHRQPSWGHRHPGATREGDNAEDRSVRSSTSNVSRCLDGLISSCSEFNLPTFAFLYSNSASDPSSHALTWFLPTGAEQVLCGHGTLGAASILTALLAMHESRSFDLDTPLAGSLRAEKAEDGQLQLDLPADDVQALEGAEREKVTEAVLKAIGGQGQVKGVWRGRLDVCIEFEMNQGVKLGDVPVDHSCLVSRPPQPCVQRDTLTILLRSGFPAAVSHLQLQRGTPRARASIHASSFPAASKTASAAQPTCCLE
jgi:hypothetical protein